MTTMNITHLDVLHDVFDHLPDGTIADVLVSDLVAGNFETVHIVMPGVARPGGRNEFAICYTGPVADGYVSPFETHEAEEDTDA